MTKVDQQRLDSLLLHLAKHGQHVNSIRLARPKDALHPDETYLHELPSALRQLTSLHLQFNSNAYYDDEHLLCLQSAPGSGYHGVLGAAAVVARLKQLTLSYCMLLDGDRGLSAALALLPGLEHLCIDCVYTPPVSRRNTQTLHLSLGDWLPSMRQLTSLKLWDVQLSTTDDGTADLRHLSALTRLADLRLLPAGPYKITTGTLPATQCLTLLQLSGYPYSFSPAALLCMTKLQHLQLMPRFQDMHSARGTFADQLLAEPQYLQELQHLTCLILSYSRAEPLPAAKAYSFLTASTNLQHLDVSGCCLPAGVWDHMFPAGRQLLQLRVLDISQVTHPGDHGENSTAAAAAPEGSHLASCCPGLQTLRMYRLRYHSESLAALSGLNSLHTLSLQVCSRGVSGAGLQLFSCCQLLQLNWWLLHFLTAPLCRL
jgi:hypothetical protein